MALLEVQSLSIGFQFRDRMLDICSDLSFTLEKGRVLGLIGESGSGKTVTCKALLRLLPGNACLRADYIRFKGRDIAALPPAEFDDLRGTEMAMIFQDPVGSFNPVKTIGWHFLHAGRRRKGATASRATVLEEARVALRMVEIANPSAALEKYPHQMSGGMLQRCLIALVLFCKPALIVADEPTTNLDNLVERQIVALFDKLRHEIDASFIFITHDMTIAEQVSDEIAVMYAGQIVEHGPTEAIMSRPQHPYTQALIGTARELEGDVERLTEIPGDITSGLGCNDRCRFGPRCSLHTVECDRFVPLVGRGQRAAVRCVKAVADEVPA